MDMDNEKEIDLKKNARHKSSYAWLGFFITGTLIDLICCDFWIFFFFFGGGQLENYINGSYALSMLFGLFKKNKEC